MDEYEQIITSIKGSLIELEDIGFKTQVLLDNYGSYSVHKSGHESGIISKDCFFIQISKLDGYLLSEVKDEINFIIDYMKRYKFSINHKDTFTYVSKDWTGRKRHMSGLPHQSDHISEITIKFINKFEIY